MPVRARVIIALLLLVVASLPTRAVALDLPAPQPVPSEVTRVFAEETLIWANQNAADEPGAAPVAAYSAIGPIHEVYGFTVEFLRGDTGAAPVRSLRRWDAPLLVQGRPQAWATVATEDGRYRTVAVSDSADGARARDTETNGYFVEGPPAIGTWIIEGETMIPADSWARRISAGPEPIAQVRPKLTAGWRSMQETGLPTWVLVLIGTIGLVGTLGTIAWLRTPRGRGRVEAPREATGDDQPGGR